MQHRRTVLTLVAVVSLLAAACNAAATPTPAPASQAPTTPAATQVPATEPPATEAPGPETYPRNETLFTTGKQWGPPSTWNPIDPNAAMGVVGLCYETLFLYDPLADKFTPWLADSASWTSPTEYTIKVRSGIKWSDGQPLTAADVAFTIELGKIKAVPYSNIWNWISAAEATDDSTVKVTFKDTNYAEWATWTYNNAIVPKHVWESKANEDILKDVNDPPVCSGPYLAKTHAEDRMVWVKNDGWWAKTALNLDVKPKYIVDIVNGANSVSLGMILQGGLDLSNNFLPGVATLVSGGYGIQTYFPQAPYMLSGNTAWLVTNDKKAPMDDKEFRKALAYSVDVDKIVNIVYGNIVAKASPTGLLPTWDKYVDKAVVDQLGFKYDPAKAKQILAAAGYKDTNGDGFVEGKDGKEIKLSIIVPNGWSDWMQSIQVIAESAKAAGINVEPSYPDYAALVDARNSGNFDLAINNEVQLSNTPWTYYDYIFHLPLQEGAGKNRNYGGYENPDAWALVQQLDKTPVDKVADIVAITSKLQKIHLEDMPVIPLWYNGMWSQVSNAVWTNWPSSAEGSNHYLPATWNGYWQMGAVLMLTELKLTPPPQ